MFTDVYHITGKSTYCTEQHPVSRRLGFEDCDFQTEGRQGDFARRSGRNVGKYHVCVTLHTSPPRFRGGLVSQAHRLYVSLNSRLASNKDDDVRSSSERAPYTVDSCSWKVTENISHRKRHEIYIPAIRIDDVRCVFTSFVSLACHSLDILRFYGVWCKD